MKSIFGEIRQVPAAETLGAGVPAAATSTGVVTGAAAGFQNSSSRAPRRLLASVCSMLKSFDLKQAAIDVLAVFALAAFLIVTALAVLGSFFILFFVALS